MAGAGPIPMTREDVLLFLKIGSAAATIVTLTIGPIGYGLYRLDSGVRDSSTLCEVRNMSALAQARNAQVQAYARFVNAKTNIIARVLGVDPRPPEHRGKLLFRGVEERRRDDAWAAVQRLEVEARELEEAARGCPKYGGIIE